MDSMKKVMGASAGVNGQKDTTGGKIQKPGQYTAKTVSGDASSVSTNKSGFSGSTEPKKLYQGK